MNCSAGRYSLVGAEVCVSCAAGKASSSAAATAESACISCAAGKYNEELGQTECGDCGAGKFLGASGSATNVCADCTEGKFAAQLEIPLARIVLEESTPVELEAFPAPSASRERPRPTLDSRSAQRAGLESTSSLRARQRAAIALAVTSLARLARQRARFALAGSTQMKRKVLALTAE